MGGPLGLIFFPDVQHKPHCYTALFMQEIKGTYSEEVKGLSTLFQQKEGKVDGHAFILLAVATVKSVLGAVQTMHATGMTHRDIKPDELGARAGPRQRARGLIAALKHFASL